MKIKTITCHDVYNYGASLQAHALMKYMAAMGNEVEIIDYKPPYLNKKNVFWRGPTSGRFQWICEHSVAFKLAYSILKYPYRFLGREKAFDRFRKKYLSLTKKRYSSFEELKATPPDGDLFLAGSDQIWNTIFPNGRDPAFYLNFVPEQAFCASYAASFATDSIAEEWKSKVQTWLRKFDKISVREKSGINILESLGFGDGSHVLDPVFLLNAEYWKTLIQEKPPERYVLVYAFEDDPEIKDIALKIAKEKGVKIFAICDGTIIPYADRNIFDAGPIEFLEYIYSAEVFISNSFHGTAFSVLLEKEFYVLGLKGYKINTRMIDLMDTLGISNRYIQTVAEVDLNKKIDYSSVRTQVEKYAGQSRDYLKMVLQYAQSKLDSNRAEYKSQGGNE